MLSHGVCAFPWLHVVQDPTPSKEDATPLNGVLATKGEREHQLLRLLLQGQQGYDDQLDSQV